MLITYLGLRKIMRRDCNKYFVSIGLLSYELTGKQIASKSITSSLLSGVNGLIKEKIITSEETDKDRRKNDWVFDLSKLQIDKVKNNEIKEFYSSVDLLYIKNLLLSDNKDKIQLIKFYCYLVTTLMKSGGKAGVGFVPYSDMASNIGICRQTIASYMNKLEENKTIHIYRSTDAILLQPNVMREIPNTYGDFNNGQLIDYVGKTHEENFGENAKRVKSSRNSSTRSASAKYNIIKNDLESTGEIRYEYKEMKQIYETLLNYNEKYKDDGIKEKKDLSIFNVYDFYQGVD